jgi:hypothetical protein
MRLYLDAPAVAAQRFAFSNLTRWLLHECLIAVRRRNLSTREARGEHGAMFELSPRIRVADEISRAVRIRGVAGGATCFAKTRFLPRLGALRGRIRNPELSLRNDSYGHSGTIP